MNIIKISQDKLNEELSYRVLAGDNSITKLNILIQNDIHNKDNIKEVYLSINNQISIQSLQDWTQAVTQEIRREIHQKQQNGSFREIIDIPWNAGYNSFSLTEALQTRTITYSYYKYDENLRPEDLHKDSRIVIEPTVKHIKQLKISDKVYDLLESLTLIIPDEIIPDNNDNIYQKYEDSMYDIIIQNQNYKNPYIFLTVHPATEQYEIVNKVDVINMTNKSKKQNHKSENIGIVAIPASEHNSLINQSNITMTDKYQIVKIGDGLYRPDKNINSIIIYELTLWTNLWEYTSDLWKKSLHKFKNIQWLYCSSENKYYYAEDKYKDFYFDMTTGCRIVLDWSLIGWIGQTKSFYLLHEQPIDNQNKDLWVYYESSSSSKTKSIYEYDEKTVATYSNLEDALKDLETKINSPCHKSGMKIKSLYLLSKQQTVDDKKETLEKHNIKIEA